jgi:hypothetical protein
MTKEQLKIGRSNLYWIVFKFNDKFKAVDEPATSF